MLGKISAPYTTSSALNPTLINTHGSHILLGKSTQSRHMDMASVLCVGTNSLLLMNTCHPTAASPPPQELQPRRKRQSSLRCLLPGEDLTGPLLLCGKMGAYLSGRQLRCPCTGQRSVLSSISESVQSSSHSQHVPVRFSEESALPHTTSTMTDCFTADPETVSAHSLNLLNPPVVLATGLATMERKENN